MLAMYATYATMKLHVLDAYIVWNMIHSTCPIELSNLLHTNFEQLDWNHYDINNRHPDLPRPSKSHIVQDAYGAEGLKD